MQSDVDMVGHLPQIIHRRCVHPRSKPNVLTTYQHFGFYQGVSKPMHHPLKWGRQAFCRDWPVILFWQSVWLARFQHSRVTWKRVSQINRQNKLIVFSRASHMEQSEVLLDCKINPKISYTKLESLDLQESPNTIALSVAYVGYRRWL